MMYMVRRSNIIIALLWALCAPAFAQTYPAPLTQYNVQSQTSANGVSNFVLTAPRKGLYSFTVLSGASAGFVLVFDAAALPSNGAVDQCTSFATARPCELYCWPVAANSSLSVQWMSPVEASTGFVLGFSTGANCDTLTASTTAKFIAQAL